MNVKGRITSGLVINLLFALLNGLIFIVNILVMTSFLTPEEVGLFAIALAFTETFILLSDFGTMEKFVQDSSEDVVKNYQTAFTINLMFSVLLTLTILILAPIVAGLYKLPILWPLLSVMSYTAFTGTLTMPLGFFYKELDFLKQRLFPLAGKVAGVLTTAFLAYLGAGVWCLAGGGIVTLLVTAIPLWFFIPIKHSWNLDLPRVKSYLSFGLNLWLAKVSGVATQQGAVLLLSVLLGIKEVGNFKLSEMIATYALVVQGTIGQTVYPLLCRLQTSTQELRRIFLIICKVGMLWAAPVGMALFLFSDDLVLHVFPNKWNGVGFFLQVQGGAVLFGSIAHAWDFFTKALGKSEPILMASLVLILIFVGIFVPAVFFFRYRGIAVGIGAIVVGGIVIKQHYVGKLFQGVSIFGAVLPELTAVGLMGGMISIWKGWVGWTCGSLLLFGSQFAVFIAGYLLIVALIEKNLIWEIASFFGPLSSDRASTRR